MLRCVTGVLMTDLQKMAVVNLGKSPMRVLPVLVKQNSMANIRFWSTSSAVTPSVMNTRKLTKNVELWSMPEVSRNFAQQRLVVLFSYMLAKRKHMEKYGRFYFQQGFDVLCVHITPMELMLPEKGTQVVAKDVLDFLIKEPVYQNIVVHGFSVGGYQYGECLVRLVKNREKYGSICDRVVGQIFDSAVDYYGIPTGLPAALTKNVVLRKVMEMMIKTHLSIFHGVSSKHYLLSQETFHNNPIKTPALFFFSKTDTVGTRESNLKVIQSWERLGMPVHAKCFEKSPHVMHFQRYRDDYLQELSKFLKNLNLLNVPYKKEAVIANGSKL